MLGKRTFFLMVVVLPLVGIAAMLPLAWLAFGSLAGSYYEYAARDAKANARLFGLAARLPFKQGDAAGLASLLGKARDGSQTRYTIVDVSGRVLADSDEDPDRMENHLHRPEIAAAVGGREGVDIRRSATLDKELLYIAIPAPDLGDGAVIRAAMELGDISSRLDAWRWRLLTGAVIGFLAMLALSLFSARMLSKPLEQLAAGADRFSQGDLRHRLSETGTSETRLLATSLNRMAAELDNRFDQINRQRHDMQAILSSMGDGVVAVDGDENVLFMNRAAQQLLGLSDAALSGRYIGELLRQPELLDFIKTVAGGETMEREIRLALPFGEVWLSVRGGVLKKNDGESGNGLLIVLRDITRLRRLERVRQDFIANASHELRTPITAIQASLETIRDGGHDDPEAAREFLSVAIRHSRRLNAIITDLLLLSAMENSETPGLGKTSSGNARFTIEAAIRQCRENAASKHVALELDCPGEIVVTANHSLLEQAVVNLVDNAIRHGAADSMVWIQAGETIDGRLRIVVTDSGPGIEPRYAKRVFERFYRIGGNREGSGLGLAIVKHIAMAHGGEVSLESTPGVGSTFAFSVPLVFPVRSKNSNPI